MSWNKLELQKFRDWDSYNFHLEAVPVDSCGREEQIFPRKLNWGWRGGGGGGGWRKRESVKMDIQESVPWDSAIMYVVIY